MLLDPLYWVIIAVGFLLSFAASSWVRHRVTTYSEVTLSSGLTGREIAQKILDARGIRDVTIERTEGRLSDHYDPGSKTLRLSEDIYEGRSVAAAGIAAHEVGHALQDQAGYAPMAIRQKMVPVANIGTNLGIWITIGGLITGLTGLAQIGVVLFGGFVAFTLVTLPVEFDASFRARDTLDQYGLVTARELEGVNKVLVAAAATYVAAAVAAILQLLYWMSRVYGRH